jgi:outer membrane protein
MKNGAIVLNVVLLIAVGVLFYFHFASNNSHEPLQNRAIKKDSFVTVAPGGCNIAYFEMDSVEANFEAAKEWKNELEKKEDAMNTEMTNLQNLYQEKFNNLQQRGSSMTATQVEAAKTELNQLDERMRNTKSRLDQEYKSYYVQTQQEILSMIRKFCTDYNKNKGYAVIIADEPGLIFYKDSTFDITSDLLVGLNKIYTQKKLDKKKE